MKTNKFGVTLRIVTVFFLMAAFHPATTAVLKAQSSTSELSNLDADLTPEQLKDLLATTCESSRLPALWAGRFFNDERPAIVAAAGTRKWETEDLAEADDKVHLGSCTKAMTAAIIGQLCTEDKLRLDTTLGEVFEDTPLVKDSDWGSVTMEQLLQHRSGAIANFWIYQSFDQSNPDSAVAARGALLHALCRKTRPRAPQFVYSNVGYIVLGHVAEHLEGKPWEQLVAERVFRPLGMESAGFGPVGRPDGTADDVVSLPDRPWGHTPEVGLLAAMASVFGKPTKPGFTPRQIDNSRCLGPAGRVHMNLRDWSKFVMAFASKDGNRKLGISGKVWKQLLTPPSGSDSEQAYAGGWMVFDKPEYNGRAFFHNGSNTTWYCYALAIPGKNACVLVATNVFNDPARKACDEVARFINKSIEP
ncbi:serine hydrolase domain-containing protein [Roseiconus nitratireducens]|uniref:serine hydrolase domain-containing protein n=1 Tax=Roseiconus nitratireducens TaxID=2605748 RepID=UPI0013757C50|nr:serine hydrolase domain-containing protein [Roseiconus nitratireducens]